jgi:hypothetical protein
LEAVPPNFVNNKFLSHNSHNLQYPFTYIQLNKSTSIILWKAISRSVSNLYIQLLASKEFRQTRVLTTIQLCPYDNKLGQNAKKIIEK